MSITKDRKLRRKMRIRANIWGTKERPRISVYRSNMYVYAQAIDDEGRITLASSSTYAKQEKKLKKSDAAKEAGVALAKKLIEKNIKAGVFDRNRYAYNGRVKMFAEGLREGGLQI